MSEAEKEVDTEGAEPEINEQEQIARAQGWRPKEEAEELVAAGKWVPADEINRRKEFFDAIHKANQENKRIRTELTALQEHHKKVEQVAYERAKAELLEQRKLAAKENRARARARARLRLARARARSLRSLAPWAGARRAVPDPAINTEPGAFKVPDLAEGLITTRSWSMPGTGKAVAI